MLSDEPIDEDFQEDLEALLYAQVYYGKEQEVELPNLLESKPTQPERQEEDQRGATSEGTSSRRHFNQKKRYYENNLIQEDKEKEITASLAKELNTTESIIKQNLNIEDSTVQSATETNITPEILEKFQDQILPPQKESELENTTNQQVIKISTSSPSTNPLSKDSSTQFVTTLSTPSEAGHPQLLNNITINQYLFPPSFQERLKSSLENTPISKKCKSDLNKLKRGHISEQDFFNNLRRRLKIQRQQQSKIRKAYLKKQQSIARSEVIYLSDSNSSDIEIVEVTNSGDNSKNKSPTMKEKVEVLLEQSEEEGPEDDEIIYVAPPPVPVISIDTESESDSSNDEEMISEHVTASTQTPNNAKSSQTLPDSQQDIDETSDDFLQPKNTPDNFNFSLHGSDFQNTEFVRPVNPTDIYETESSTSTSDFNRDSSRQFCNSVKTIVFNEVEFPNQDIFDESNLESFGEFITPRRADKEKLTEASSSSVDKPGTSKSNKRINPRTSSESSSESEYEGSTAHQNLPDLSPMVCAESSPKKGKARKKNLNEPSKKKKSKIEEQRDYNTRSNKKKIKDKFVDQGIIDETELPVVKEPTRKTKRKSIAALEEEEIPKKKSKKKKNNSGNKSAEDNEDISEASNSASDRSTSPRKNLKDSCQVTSSTPSKKKGIEVNNAPDESSKKKRKRNRKHSKNSNLGVAVIEQGLLTVKEKDTTEDCSKKKGKKKTKESIQSSEDHTVQDILEETNQALAKDQGNDSSKKKNKKRKQKASSESRVVSEASSTTNVENESSTRTEKEQNANLNRSSEEQENLIEESNVLEQTDSSENNSNKKKNKRKKRVSTDKRSSVEESNISEVENEKTQDKGKEKSTDEPLEEGELVEDKDTGISDKNVIEVPQTPEEDVILIEKVIPVHTIDSSESENEDILTFEDVGNNLELANISANVSTQDNLELANIPENISTPKGTNEKLGIVISNREFDVDYVQSKMSDDPEKWKILPADRYNQSITKKGPRCNKCRHFGHISISCPNKPAKPICTLCGELGHQEPRCPNKVCFTCGKPGNFSTVYCYMCAKQRQFECTVCFMVGHKTEYCPDLWRRYFLTTKEGPLTVPRKNCPALKPRNKQWCSGCASNGHLEFQCDTYQWIREYPASSPRIFKYKDVYADQRKERPQTPPRSAPSNQDRARLQYQKFVASLNLSKSSETRPEQFTPRQETVTDYTENQEASEKPAESLDDTTEKQGEEQQIVEGQPIVEAASEDQNIPGINSGIFESTANKSAQAPPYQIHFSPPSGQRGRSKQKRNSPKNTKINPVSVLRPSGYTPYQSVLNPYSVLGAPSARPPQGLFNQVPADMLAKQLVDLTSNAAHYQDLDQSTFNQNSYFQNQTNFYQYRSQIPIHPSPLLGSSLNTHQSFSQSFPASHSPEPYRDYLDMPHTITRDPREDRERIDIQSPYYRLEERDPFIENRERQVSLQREFEYGFHGRRQQERVRYIRDLQDSRGKLSRPGTRSSTEVVSLDIPSLMELPVNPSVFTGEMPEPSVAENQTHNNQFYSLNTIGEDNAHIFNKNLTFINVDESTMKKFNASSNSQLKELISNELSKLAGLQQADAKAYKKKLNSIENLKKIDFKTNSVKKQMYFLFKQLNMFLFGVHHLFEGKRNLDYLRHFASEYTGGINEGRRQALLQAYGYIFGGEHPDFNYRRYLNTLTVTNKK